jgi:hypothetical protein
VPASGRARAAQAAAEPYELLVEVDPDNPDHWIASEHPREKQDAAGNVIVTIAGHGLGFLIDRCTGAISRMHDQR